MPTTPTTASSSSSTQLRQLYPPIQPYSTQMLQVSPLHSVYVEESGNPKGKAVIALHGGPGGGSDPYMRQFFDPSVYRIVLADQRGAGHSTPRAELRENTTQLLVDDVERIREKLGVEQWTVVFGGSWGSTLSLAYAQAHPQRVKSLVLRGIFLLRRKELLWFYQEGASFLFPGQLPHPLCCPLSTTAASLCLDAYLGSPRVCHP